MGGEVVAVAAGVFVLVDVLPALIVGVWVFARLPVAVAVTLVLVGVLVEA